MNAKIQVEKVNNGFIVTYNDKGKDIASNKKELFNLLGFKLGNAFCEELKCDVLELNITATILDQKKEEMK